jgi:hypothetical protein
MLGGVAASLQPRSGNRARVTASRSRAIRKGAALSIAAVRVLGHAGASSGLEGVPSAELEMIRRYLALEVKHVSAEPSGT